MSSRSRLRTGGTRTRTRTRELRRSNALHRYGPLLLVAIVVVFNLWVLRAEATPVNNLNDGSVHRSMIAWAERRWEGGHLPLDGWYPQLGLGSSRFHHYQSMPHVVTGLVSTVTGSASAYAWSLYLMLALWPIAVYLGGRLWGFGRWRSACAALASPLIVERADARVRVGVLRVARATGRGRRSGGCGCCRSRGVSGSERSRAGARTRGRRSPSR